MKYFFAFTLMVFSCSAMAQDISGYPLVVDGNTIRFGETQVRLWGIIVPDLNKPGGKESKAFPQGALVNTWIHCNPRDQSTSTPVVAQCWRSDGIQVRDDVAYLLVSYGYARDWPTHSKGYYAR